MDLVERKSRVSFDSMRRTLRTTGARDEMRHCAARSSCVIIRIASGHRPLAMTELRSNRGVALHVVAWRYLYGNNSLTRGGRKMLRSLFVFFSRFRKSHGAWPCAE